MSSSLTGFDPSRDPQPADNLILWLPVFLCVGIGLYFLLPFEPALKIIWGGVAGALMLVLATWRLRDFLVWRWLASFLLMASLGLGLVYHSTHHKSVPLLRHSVWNAQVSGTIDSFERAGAGWRLVLRDAVIDDKPTRYILRLSVRMRGFVPDMDGKVTMKASLMAPSPSIVPGSFDFRRHAFFQQISGYGYATKILSYQKPERQAEEKELENYRDWLTEKVYAVLDQPEAGIVTALLNGQRAGISRQTTSILQKSGLQHVISISGLHVGLMAMTIFFCLRFLLALSMTVALRFPIKKIAAGAAIIGVIFYMMIVGSSPPTLRAVIMTCAALLAIMLDREPIQMRVVALSALAILLLQPESMIDIGFQMSFAAVIGLVAFYQQTRNFWTHAAWQNNILMKSLRVLVMTMATSIIATVVTAPLVLFYFQQIPLLSMLSNVLATPPVTFLVMPGTFLAYLLAPVPVLGDMAIRMMGWGVTLMMDIATFVARLPSSVWQTHPISLWTALLVMLGFYIVFSVKHDSRYAGLVLVLAGIGMMPFYSQPDFYLTQSRVVLYPDPAGDVLYAQGKVASFDKSILMQWTGTKEIRPFACETDICDMVIKNRTIRLIRSVPALEQACEGQKVDVILTPYYLDKPCGKTLILDRHRLDRKGAQALWLQPVLRTRSARQSRHSRAWQ